MAGETPDGRVGAAVLLFGFSSDGLAKAVPNRTGQCVMTCPSAAVFDGLSEQEERRLMAIIRSAAARFG